MELEEKLRGTKRRTGWGVKFSVDSIEMVK